MKRIICIGNSLIPGDDAGSRVYRQLRRRQLPADVEALEGGIAGMGLLPLIEKSERVVFVDQVNGFGSEGEVILMDNDAVKDLAAKHATHAAGLPYLLKILPLALANNLPETVIIGIEHRANPKSVRKAATLAIAAATGTLIPKKNRNAKELEQANGKK